MAALQASHACACLIVVTRQEASRLADERKWLHALIGAPYTFAALRSCSTEQLQQRAAARDSRSIVRAPAQHVFEQLSSQQLNHPAARNVACRILQTFRPQEISSTNTPKGTGMCTSEAAGRAALEN